MAFSDVALNKVDPEIAKQIQLRERAIREEKQALFDPYSELGFFKFCQYMDSDFFTDEKTLYIELCEILRKSAIYCVYSDKSYIEYKRIIINVFPRFGKSYIVSLWCVYVLAYANTRSIMRNAVNAKLAEKFSRDIRKIINDVESKISKRFHKVFPDVLLDPSKKELKTWALKSSDQIAYFCSGIGGNITGHGCDLASILDDPISSPAEAESQNELEKQWDWYNAAHITRVSLKDCVSEIIIMTRWSKNDIVGRLLRLEPEKWKVFIIDAENQFGDSACEAIMPTETLHAFRKKYETSGKVHLYNSLYRQKPIDKSGLVFDIDNLKRFRMSDLEVMPGGMIVGFLDYADEGEDFLSFPIAYFWNGNYYFIDVLFTVLSSSRTTQMCLDMILKWKPIKVIIEAQVGGSLLKNVLREKLIELSESGSIDFITTIKSIATSKSAKVVRISIAEEIILNNCYFLDKSEYTRGSNYDNFINNITEYSRNGANEHDDAPDSVAGIISNFRNSRAQC